MTEEAGEDKPAVVVEEEEQGQRTAIVRPAVRETEEKTVVLTRTVVKRAARMVERMGERAVTPVAGMPLSRTMATVDGAMTVASKREMRAVEQVGPASQSCPGHGGDGGLPCLACFDAFRVTDGAVSIDKEREDSQSLVHARC